LLAGSVRWILASILIKVSGKYLRICFIYTTGFSWTQRPDDVRLQLGIVRVHVVVLLEGDTWTHKHIETEKDGRVNGFTGEWVD
jgi:hypothetical protein